MILTRRQRWTGFAGGALALAGIFGFILAAVIALLSIGRSSGLDSLVSDPVIWPALRFTLWQAGLSTLLSVAFAVPVARALARRPRFFGRIWLVRLMAVPMGLPVLIGALGLLGVWGRSGLVNTIWVGLGGERLSIYGLSGILLAHVFFNMPLAARLLLAALERLPGEYWLISAELGMRPRSVFRFVEWPAMARVIPGAAGLVFMLCATSFTLVLMLGGGPAATTLEVAIYQALRFDFDPGRAVTLGLLQIGVTGVILAVLSTLPSQTAGGIGEGRAIRRFDGQTVGARFSDGLVIVMATLFLCLPLGSVVASGLKSDLAALAQQPVVLQAGLTSLVIGALAALLSVLLGLLLVNGVTAARERRRAALAERGFAATLHATGSIVLLVPAIVLATGWFLVLRPFGEIARFAPVIVVAINALMALPFVMRILSPAIEEHHRTAGRLVASLGLSGWTRVRLIDLPRLGKPLAMAFSFAMALSLGDLGAVALFGAENLTTLPWLIYSRMGSYRTNDADGLALMLGVICLALTVLGTPRGARAGGGARSMA